MKFRLKKQQMETLLRRQANSQRTFTAPPPKRGFSLGSGWKRTAWEAALGILAALPVGAWLYYFVIFVWTEVIGILAMLAVSAIPGGLIPAFGPSSISRANDSIGIVLILFASAALIEVFACRALIRRHYPVLAYTQAILGLAASLPFFYWTAVHQKPLLPF